MEVSGNSSGALRDEFLQLLVAQVRNQDPLEPVGQEAFIQQLASFSTLEGIEKLNANFESMLRLSELSQGTALLGKTATFETTAGIGTGVVRSVRVDAGEVQLDVDGQSVPLSRIVELSA